MEDEDNVGRADCTPSLSLSLSRSLSLSLCLSLSQSRGAPAAALPAAGDLRRGCTERAKASSQWAQPEKCLRGRRMTSLRVALTLAGNDVFLCSGKTRRVDWTGSSTISKLWRSSTAEGRHFI